MSDYFKYIVGKSLALKEQARNLAEEARKLEQEARDLEEEAKKKLLEDFINIYNAIQKKGEEPNILPHCYCGGCKSRYCNAPECDNNCMCTCTRCGGFREETNHFGHYYCNCDQGGFTVETEKICRRCASWEEDGSDDLAMRILKGNNEISSSRFINIRVASVSAIVFAVFFHDNHHVIKGYLPLFDSRQISEAFTTAYKLRKFDICVLFLENDLSLLWLTEYEVAIGNISFLLKLFIHFVKKKGVDINTVIYGEYTMLNLLKFSRCGTKKFIESSIRKLVKLGAEDVLIESVISTNYCLK
jgi:hypothetical protein